jgi:drug/metabolite transporter (DMT)-like permease
MNRAFVVAVVKILAAAALWGAAYPLTKGALTVVPPLTLGFLRFSLAGLLLMLWTRSRPLQGVPEGQRTRVVWLAFWGSFVLVAAMNLGLRLAPAGLASMISGTPPLFAVFFAWYRLGEPLRISHFVALGMASAGIILLAGDISVPGFSGMAILGIVLVTLPQVAWAIYSVLGKELLAASPWPMVCRDTFCLGALMLLPLAAIETAIVGFGQWNTHSVGVLLYLGIANSVLTYGLWNSALAVVPVSLASFLLYAQPISGAILSFIMFGDAPGMMGLIGIFLLFAGVAVVLHQQARAAGEDGLSESGSERFPRSARWDDEANPLPKS